MIRVDEALRAERPRAAPRAALGALGGEDPRPREELEPGRRVARLHAARTLHGARLDRVDAGLPVRLGAPAVRRDRRARVPRARPRAHLRAHGAARHPHGRARPRLQQRQHLGRAAAAAARGPLRRPRAASASSASSRSRRAARCRRGAGRGPPTAAATSTPSTARTRSSPTPCARCARSRSRTGWARRCSRRATGPSRCSSGCCSTRARPRASPSTGAAGRDAWDERGPRGAREPVRRRRRQLPLPVHAAGLLALHDVDARARPGCCSASRSSSSSSETLEDAELEPFGGRAEVETRHAGGGARWSRATTWRRRRPTACRTGTRARPGLATARRATATGRRTPRTTSSPSTRRRRRSRRRGCCGSAGCSSSARPKSERPPPLPGRADGRADAARPRRT